MFEVTAENVKHLNLGRPEERLLLVTERVCSSGIRGKERYEREPGDGRKLGSTYLPLDRPPSPHCSVVYTTSQNANKCGQPVETVTELILVSRELEAIITTCMEATA